jgi:hypothetical protein
MREQIYIYLGLGLAIDANDHIQRDHLVWFVYESIIKNLYRLFTDVVTLGKHGHLVSDGSATVTI